MYQSLSFYRSAAIFSAVALLLLGVGFLQPFSFGDDASAESKDIDVSVTLEPTISISTNVDAVNIAVAASDYEALLTDSVTVSVGTNNTYGYTLTMSAEGSETALVNSGNSNIKIPTLTAETTSTAWAGSSDLNNKWGFTHDNTDLLPTDTYLPVVAANEANDTTIKETGEPSSSSDTAVTFATKVDASQLSGEYQNTVIFSAIANAEAPKTYMQDVTYANWCANLTDYDAASTETQKATTYELWDKRTNFDNEYPYYIRKLADGNCWMVENLYLEGGKTLTSSDSNVSSDYSLPASSTSSGFSSDAAANIFSGGRNRDGYKQGSYAADGSYMTWVLAKAGTATGKDSDVCPKNWRLPTGSANGSAASASEQAYLVSLGYSTFDTFFFADKDGGNNSATPIYPGYHGSSALSANGFYVYWWSSTQSTAIGSYVLSRYGTRLETSSSSRRSGYSVRCLLASS